MNVQFRRNVRVLPTQSVLQVKAEKLAAKHVAIAQHHMLALRVHAPAGRDGYGAAVGLLNGHDALDQLKRGGIERDEAAQQCGGDEVSFHGNFLSSPGIGRQKAVFAPNHFFGITLSASSFLSLGAMRKAQ